MRRAIGFLGTLLLIALSFSLYTLVNAVKAQEKQLRDLNAAIARESENTRVLRADWSYLNQPERLQALARQHLTLVPTVARQIVILANLPERTTGTDAIAAAPAVDASQLPFRETATPVPASVPGPAASAPKPVLSQKAVATPRANAIARKATPTQGLP